MPRRSGRDATRIDGRAGPHAIFVGFNALGDTLCTTPVIHAYRRQHPDARITYIVQSAPYTRVLDGNPDIDLVLYSESLTRNGLRRVSVDWVREQPVDLSQGAAMVVFDMNHVCTSWDAFQSHIATGFSRLARIPIDGVRPIVHVSAHERAAAAGLVRRPYAVLSMHSNANPPRVGGGGRAKDWPAERFAALCAHLRERGIVDIVAIASEFDDRRTDPQWRSLHGLPIKVVAALLQDAALVVTLENGIGHLAHAVDAPMVMIYSDIVPLGWANPVEATRCEVLYGDPQALPLDDVVAAADRVRLAKPHVVTVAPFRRAR